MPAGIDRVALVEPEYVHFPGADGTPVPGWLFVPKNLDLSKKHRRDHLDPRRWHQSELRRLARPAHYAMYYSFHQYLLQQGYVVFAPDYRGSIGYGREWRNGRLHGRRRQGRERRLDGRRTISSAALRRSQRIGVWGLSYGGFFTLIAMTDHPTLFRAAVDVAGVAITRCIT